ncbi:MAG: DinB family protein [Gemmatimonadales bacterium]
MSVLLDSYLTTIAQIKFFADRALKGDIPEAARRFQVHPGTATIHWLIGHAAFTIDRISLSALEGPAALPDAHQALFGWSTKPDGTNAGFPAWEESVADLYGAIDRLRAHVASRSDADLLKPLSPEHPFAKMIASQGAIVPFTALHTGYHLGQVSTLRRAQGLPSGMGV